MRILIVVNALTYGGAEKQAVMDANMLSENGCDVAFAYKNDGDLRTLLSRRVRQYHISPQFIPLASLQLLFHLLLNRYDVIHCHLFWAAMITMIPAILTRQQYVVNEHGQGNWRRWYHLVIIRRIYRFAAKVITPCKAVMDTIVQRERVEVDKVCVIYNAFDSDRLEQDGNVIPEGVGANGFKIGYVGRFSPIKKLEVFLALAKILNAEIPNLHFILVGDGPEKQRICAEIENEELGEFFSLPGFVDNPHAYYKNFDVFILPSESEGFSLALLEAASASKPVIAFDVGGNAEIIIDGVTGLLVPYCNIKLLAAKVLHLHGNINDRINMGKTASAYATKRFSPSVRLHALSTLYGNL